MKKSLIFAAVTAVLASGSVASAQDPVQLVNDWKIEAGQVTWLLAGSDTTRGLAKIPGGNLLVASRSDGNFLRRLDPATGTEVTPPIPNATYAGGTHIIAKVGVNSEAIYVCNLAIAGANFRVYRHADELSEATIAYAEDGAVARLGDAIEVTGIGNNTTLLVGMSGSATVAKLTSADGGATFTKALLTPENPAISGAPNLSIEPAGTHFWFRNTAGTAGGRYDINTAVGEGLAVARPGSTLYGAIRVGNLDGTLHYALNSGNVSAGNTVMVGEIYLPSNLTPPAFPQVDPPDYGGLLYYSPSVRPAGGMNANGNGAGEVVFAEDKVYWLVTNNVVARDTFPTAPTSAKDWNLY